MNLEQFFRPLRNPKVAGSILFISLGLSALLGIADYKVHKEYYEAGGNTNVHSSNFEKLKYINNHSKTSYDNTVPKR